MMCNVVSNALLTIYNWTTLQYKCYWSGLDVALVPGQFFLMMYNAIINALLSFYNLAIFQSATD